MAKTIHDYEGQRALAEVLFNSIGDGAVTTDGLSFDHNRRDCHGDWHQTAAFIFVPDLFRYDIAGYESPGNWPFDQRDSHAVIIKSRKQFGKPHADGVFFAVAENGLGGWVNSGNSAVFVGGHCSIADAVKQNLSQGSLTFIVMNSFCHTKHIILAMAIGIVRHILLPKLREIMLVVCPSTICRSAYAPKN